MSKHTPGPWKIRKGFDEGTKEIYFPNPKIKKPFYPTELCVVAAEGSEGKSNARLIAAAPDLLEALKGMLGAWNMICDASGWERDHIQQQKDAVAAIAKATGEST